VTFNRHHDFYSRGRPLLFTPSRRGRTSSVTLVRSVRPPPVLAARPHGGIGFLENAAVYTTHVTAARPFRFPEKIVINNKYVTMSYASLPNKTHTAVLGHLSPAYGWVLTTALNYLRGEKSTTNSNRQIVSARIRAPSKLL